MCRVDEFADYLLKERQYSKHTVIAYVVDVRQFCEFCKIEGNDVELAKITIKDVRAWLAMEMRAKRGGEPGLGAASGKRKLSSLRAFFRFLEKKGVVENNPVENLTGPKVDKRLPVFVREDVMGDVLEKMEGVGGFSGLRDRLIILLIYETGVRRSELLGLRVRDFDFHRSCLRVLGKGDKEREIPMLRELAQEVQVYLEMREELVGGQHDIFFVTDKGRPIYGQFVYRLVRKVLADDVSLERRSPHVLRHTFATHLLNNGASIEGIKDLLGHASVGTTQVYAHNTVERMKKIFNQAHPRA